METNANWEYRVKTFGTAWRSAKNEEVNEELDLWGIEGWEVASSCFNPGGSLLVIAKRPLTDTARRRKNHLIGTY